MTGIPTPVMAATVPGMAPSSFTASAPARTSLPAFATACEASAW